MALEQREMVTRQIREHVIPEQPKKKHQSDSRRSGKVFSAGEKFLFIVFATVVVAFASMILHNEGQLNGVNREVHALNGKIEEKTKQNTELSNLAGEQSTYDIVWEKAKILGLKPNENNVKVVPGR